MHPQVRSYIDAVAGLEAQLAELIGLVRIVPPLVEADRRRRWEEIGARPGDQDVEMIDVYESEAGPEEGWGQADFSRTIQTAAIVTAWGAFHECLARLLFESSLRYQLGAYPALARLVADERRKWDRRFEDLQRRYKDFQETTLTQLEGWEAVAHAQELRNALVHNSGLYTRAYLNTKLARRPTRDDLLGLTPPGDDALVGREPIPLSPDFTREVISGLLAAAKKVRDGLVADEPPETSSPQSHTPEAPSATAESAGDGTKISTGPSPDA
jgi:hypothetical protein